MTSRISSLAAVLFLAGCDPGWRIQGTVMDGAGAPITGASVALSCPGAGTGAGAMPQTELTNAAGHFEFGGVSGAGNASKCTLAISKTGFTTRSIGSMDACFRSTKTRNLGQPCGPVEGRIALSP